MAGYLLLFVTFCTHQCWKSMFDMLYNAGGAFYDEDKKGTVLCENRAITNWNSSVLTTVNTWSSLAFIIVGNYIISLAIIEFEEVH